MRQVSGQYLAPWTVSDVWVELFFEFYEEWYNDCEDWVCVPLFDDSTFEWEICSGSCVKPKMALVRCGNCGSSCVLDGLAHEEDASERAWSDAGGETCISASQSPENECVCVATCPQILRRR